jgi:sugar lactone lactonase YvrE
VTKVPGWAEATAKPRQLDVPAMELGEGPVFDAASQELYWIDIPAGLVYRLGPDGTLSSWQAGMHIGSVFPRAAGGLILPARDGFLALDTATGAVSMLAQAEADKPDNRMNDGACDSAGRLYAGTMAADESPGKGALYRLDPDLTLTELVSGVSVSNGIGWSPDNTLMYYSDSLAYRIDVFDYDAATGDIAGQREFAPFGGGDIEPDGLTVDAEGGVWVAGWGGGTLTRYLPDGSVDRVVEFPHPHVTSVAFAGPGLDLLYVTTAAGPEGDGGLFLLRPGITGLPAHRFGG